MRSGSSSCRHPPRVQRSMPLMEVEARTGIPMLDPQARLAVEVALNVYKGILDKLVENDYDNFRKRAYVSKPEKFLMLPQSWWNVKDLSP